MGKKFKQSQMSKEIYRLHLNLIKDFNNMQIFLDQSISILTKTKNNYKKSKEKIDKYYTIKSKNEFAKRTDKELKKIYDDFLSRRYLESFFVTSISRFEDFLFFCLFSILKKNPERLVLNIEGIELQKEINFKEILIAKDINNLLEKIINKKLISLFYTEPKKYMKYFTNILRIKIDEILLEKFIEIKSTRDLIIHNRSIVNEIYLNKVKKLARGKLNEKIPFNKDYFDSSIFTLKKMSSIVRREIDKNYPLKIKKK